MNFRRSGVISISVERWHRDERRAKEDGRARSNDDSGTSMSPLGEVAGPHHIFDDYLALMDKYTHL